MTLSYCESDLPKIITPIDDNYKVTIRRVQTFTL